MYKMHIITPRLGSMVLLIASAAISTTPAFAQAAHSVSEFERPYGYGYGAENRPYHSATRDANGNQLVINGLIGGGSGLGTGLYTDWGQTENVPGIIGSGTAIGNQLNVHVNGSYNTVIIDSTQINTGDQTTSLNGELDF